MYRNPGGFQRANPLLAELVQHLLGAALAHQSAAASFVRPPVAFSGPAVGHPVFDVGGQTYGSGVEPGLNLGPHPVLPHYPQPAVMAPLRPQGQAVSPLVMAVLQHLGGFR